MNLHGLDAGSFFCVPAGSKNKYLAWEYAKLATAIDKTPDFRLSMSFSAARMLPIYFVLFRISDEAADTSPFD